MKALKVVAIGLGYVVFFAVCTALFVRFLLFPTEQAKDFATQRLAEMSGAESVTIGDIGLTGIIPNGIEIEQLKMKLPGIKVKTAERGGTMLSDARRVDVDELTIKASLGSLLSGTPDVTFDARIGTGTIRGAHYFHEKDGPHVLKIEKITDVPVGPERLFQTFVGYDIRGKLSGTVDLTVPVGERDGKMQPMLDQMSGRVDIQLANAAVWSPIVDTAQGRMALTDVDLGQVKLIVVAEGTSAQPQTGDPKARSSKGRDATVLVIEEASVDGPDLGVAAAPRSTISFVAGGSLKEAVVNIHLALKIEEALMDKEMEDPKHPGSMIKPNVGLKYMMQANPIKSQVTDGQLGLAITGTLGDVKPRTERPRVKVGGSGATRKMNLDHPDGEDGDEEAKPPTESAKPTVAPTAAETNRRPTTVARPSITHSASPGGRPRPVMPSTPPVIEAPHVAPTPEAPPSEPAVVEPTGEPPPEGEVPEGGGEVDPNAPPEEPQ